MRFQLAITFDGMKMYGSIYDFGTGLAGMVEEYVVDDTNDWFLEHMIDKINATCDTLLDNGDFDYIDAEKCKELIKMINDFPNGFVPKEFEKVIDILLDYAHRAIEYNTGIEIEM